MYRVLKPPDATIDGCIAFLAILYPDLRFSSKNVDLDKSYKTCDALIDFMLRGVQKIIHAANGR